MNNECTNTRVILDKTNNKVKEKATCWKKHKQRNSGEWEISIELPNPITKFESTFVPEEWNS